MGCEYVGRGTSKGQLRILTPYDPTGKQPNFSGAGPADSNFTARGGFTHITAPPNSTIVDQAIDGFTIFEAMPKCDLFSLGFYMIMDDASNSNNKTGTARIWLAREFITYGQIDPNGQPVTQYLGRFIADLSMTCGSRQIVASARKKFFPPGARFVDTIVIDNDATLGGIKSLSNTTDDPDFADACAFVAFDIEGASHLIIQTSGDGGTPSSRVGVCGYPI